VSRRHLAVLATISTGRSWWKYYSSFFELVKRFLKSTALLTSHYSAIQSGSPTNSAAIQGNQSVYLVGKRSVFSAICGRQRGKPSAHANERQPNEKRR